MIASAGLYQPFIDEFLANHENEDWINGEKTEDIVAFLDRLYTAKRKVEKRIAVLGGELDAVSRLCNICEQLMA